MPKKKKPKAVMVDGIPIKPVSPAEQKGLERRITKKYETAATIPEVHGKKVDWISHWHEEGYLSFNVRFTDGRNFPILCSPTIVTNVVDFSDVKTGGPFRNLVSIIAGATRTDVGIWKVGTNAKITVETRAVLEEFAAKEHRSLGNLCFVLLTWATEQLQKAGTIERLLGKRVPIPRQGLQRNKPWNPESTK